MWVERQARYPIVRSTTWWTRFHLLRRKLDSQGSIATVNDCRVAEILAASAPQGSAADAAVASMLGRIYRAP
jgi:hypothetical protein